VPAPAPVPATTTDDRGAAVGNISDASAAASASPALLNRQHKRPSDIALVLVEVYYEVRCAAGGARVQGRLYCKEHREPQQQRRAAPRVQTRRDMEHS
jgi:hypothetical protein